MNSEKIKISSIRICLQKSSNPRRKKHAQLGLFGTGYMQYFSKKNLRIYKEIFLYVSIAICKLEALSIQEFFIPISEEKANVSGIEEIHQIYVLNLEVRLARWFRTKAMLNAFGIEAQRFIGINGWMIPRGKMKNFYKELVENGQHGGLTPGQIGCLLSHLSILQHALDKKYQCVWILEDDIVVLRDPKELGDILKKLHQVDPEWDLLFTDLHARETVWKRFFPWKLFLALGVR